MMGTFHPSALRGRFSADLLRGPTALLGTKAETLRRLRPLVRRSEVLPIESFTVATWRREPTAVLARVALRFGPVELVVRSSAVAEDGAQQSMAGAFTSLLAVDGADSSATRGAIERVIASYDGDPQDQVLVQPMLHDIAVSGVVLSHDLETGAPYYVVDYDDESGKTDSITGGTGVSKTVYVYREGGETHVASPRIAAILAMVRELEGLIPGVPLDVEFGLTRSGRLHLFQVRPIAAQRRWLDGTGPRVASRLPWMRRYVAERSQPRPGVLGRRTILAVMSDWNPAEIIGRTPRPLATSLYRALVTERVWRDARVAMGYRALPGEELMVTMAGRPYIDVRNSFNSFLPAGIDDRLGERLVDAWTNRLDAHPELHDKVEFEVAQTCVDFTFDEDARRLLGDALRGEEIGAWRSRLSELTRRALDLGPTGSIAQARAAIDTLATRQEARRRLPDAGADALGLGALTGVRGLLDECRELGTTPFAILARHGFIAESLLRSAVRRGALSPERVDAFKRSVETISGRMSSDLDAVVAGRLPRETFVAHYGHLRPGTYDITSPTYADRAGDLFATAVPRVRQAGTSEFTLTNAEARALGDLLAELGWALRPEDLLTYARAGIEGREYGKFVFARSLSDALERLAGWGAKLGLSREDLSFLRLDDLLLTAVEPTLGDNAARLRERAEAGRREVELSRAFRLSYIVRGARDVFVVPVHRSAPNFIGRGRIEAPVVLLDAHTPSRVQLHGRVVCIENADPGFDWIFTKGIAGLVTRYGGANSHMAIRCAEFGLPAAIGCGERAFERVVAAGRVELSPAQKTLRPVSAVLEPDSPGGWKNATRESAPTLTVPPALVLAMEPAVSEQAT